MCACECVCVCACAEYVSLISRNTFALCTRLDNCNFCINTFSAFATHTSQYAGYGSELELPSSTPFCYSLPPLSSLTSLSHYLQCKSSGSANRRLRLWHRSHSSPTPAPSLTTCNIKILWHHIMWHALKIYQRGAKLFAKMRLAAALAARIALFHTGTTTVRPRQLAFRKSVLILA